ncbi:MAG: tRNA (N6-threonylcarbamoyladenosine(37)-N6)-methyltransferase TrmO [Bacteroidota bacterium]
MIEGIITLHPHRNFEQALHDLEGFERIWILFWFDKNKDWSPKVLPPRSGRTKRGVFSTRSPHRPNPLGLSLCKLLKVNGLSVHVENPDLLDGTPILDIKPYLPYAEAFPDSRSGWLETIDQSALPFTVVVSDLAKKQADYLESVHNIQFLNRLAQTLSRDPLPHPFRRIKKRTGGGYVIGFKSWRVVYAVKDSEIYIERIESGYSPDILLKAKKEHTPLHDEKAHRGFVKKWNPLISNHRSNAV